MGNFEKLIENAKRLGIIVHENSLTPGFVVKSENGYEKLTTRNILSACTLYNEEELISILDNRWVCEERMVQFAKPLEIGAEVISFPLKKKMLMNGGYQNVSYNAV